MIKSFFKTAVRNMLKNKVYTLINFVGLTCGLTLALLIITYVRNEYSYDQFNEKLDRMYRFRYTAPNGLELASTPPPIATVLKDHFPEVEEVARVYSRNVSITIPDQPEAFEENRILFADSGFAKIFTLDFVKGNPKRALVDKFTVLITEDMAKKYFSNEDPIGESLLLAGKSFKVTGVVKAFPDNSHLLFNMLVPYENMFDLESEQTAERLRKNLEINFVISHSYTYVLLKPGSGPENINGGMDAFLKKYAQPRFLVGQVFALMPVADIHLKSTLLAESRPTNSLSNIYIFLGIGILTLLIACINYINLSTAQSFTRIKEIGIRKILGSMKIQLISQFLAESFLFCLVSMLIAYAAFDLTLPLMNVLTNNNLQFTQIVDGVLILSSLGLLIIITLMAGGYPAWFVSQFESVNALKGSGMPGSSGQWLRKSLVVFQLAVACMLLSGSLLIIKQLDYITNRPLGFEREQIINVPLFSQNLNSIFRTSDSTFKSRLQTFRNEVEAQSEIQLTTLSSAPPGLGVVFRGTIPEGFSREDNMFLANFVVDYDFIDAYGMAIVAGRSFSREFPADETSSFMINETAVQEFKWENPEKAIGKTIEREGKTGKVIGVVKDYYFSSLTTPISPQIIEMGPNQYQSLSIKFKSTNIPSTITEVEKAWNKIFPEKAFEYTFLDEQLSRQYSGFQNFGKIIQTFTAIGILIACLGVYGLVLFTVQRKVKEIGVRKVLGANIGGILVLIYRDFITLIAIGFLLAVPGAYYLMNQWLTNFVYRTSIDVLTFAASLIMVLLVVSITISYQAIQAARMNPVKSLRSE